jgi:predicted amidophosphoribosyltransferase
MRNRHFPRLCGSCQAPMGRQEDTCWRCGTRWAAEDEPRAALRVIPGGASTHNERAATQARLDAERWIDEGGSVR